MDDSWSDVSVWSVSRPGVGPSEGVSTRRRGHGSICPAEPDESVFKVELVVGKTVQVGTQNRYFFVGQIVRETIPGWGFTRYIARRLGRGQARSGPSIRTHREWSGLSHLVAIPTLSAIIVVCPSRFMFPKVSMCVIGSGLPERKQKRSKKVEPGHLVGR